MSNYIYSEITPDILKLARQSEAVSLIDPALYPKYDVKRGLRDLNGKGVVAGLTEISTIRLMTRKFPVRASYTIGGRMSAHWFRDFPANSALVLKKLLICCCLEICLTKNS